MDGFIGEIRLMAWSFTPMYWLPCDGRLVSLQQYQALAAVIGTTYGGDGRTSIGLPDLRGRVAVAAGQDPYDTFDPNIANTGGVAAVALSTTQMPPHTHTLMGAALAPAKRVAAGQGNYIAPVAVPSTPPAVAFAFAPSVASPDTVTLNDATLSVYPGTGGMHENRQPYLALAYFICTEGEFPVRPN